MVIVNFNGKEFIKDSIDGFLMTDYPNFRIIIIDNGSTDGSRELLWKTYGTNEKILIVELERNFGFSGGCVTALKYIDGEYIVLCNNDDKPVDKDWLIELVKVVESDSTIGAAFSKKLRWDYPKQIDSVGFTINPAGFLEQIGAGELDRGQYKTTSERFGWQTPVLIRNELIQRFGGLFDSDFFIIHDDTDLSWRIWLAGYKIVFVPNSSVYHKRSATMRKLPPFIPAFYARKNILITLLKNYSSLNLLKFLPIHIAVRLLSIPFFIKRKRPYYIIATFASLLSVALNLGKIIKRRRHIQKLRKVPDAEIMKHFVPFRVKKLYTRRDSSLWPFENG